ncbi:MAG: response regulator [Mariprofundaceae bacterium]
MSALSPDYFEQLQETLLRLDRTLAREKERRKENEALLDALAALIDAQDQNSIHDILRRAFRHLIDCDDCWIMRDAGDGFVDEEKRNRLKPGPRLKAVLAGRPLNAFDVRMIPEWDDAPAQIRSALHLPMRIQGEQGMLVLVSRERAAFSAQHASLAARMLPLAEHAADRIEWLDLRHEQTLRRERLLMQTLLDHVPACAWLLDKDKRLRFANKAFYDWIGVPPETAMQARRYEDVLPAPLRELLTENDDACMQADGACQKMLTIPEKDGSERTYSIIKSPIPDTGSGLACIAIDLTEEQRLAREREEMERQLYHAQKLESLGVLAGGIAHDFNNILAAILGNAAMAEQKVSRNPMEAQQHLRRIVESTERAADLCRQMLAYSGKGKFVIQRFSLEELIDGIASMLEISLHKGVVIKKEFQPGLPMIEGDTAQIQQVLMNLVTNANDAIGKERSGIIAIRTGEARIDSDYLEQCLIGPPEAEPGRYVYVEVADNGCGMDRETIDRMFEPFFTTKFAGRGLGMSAVMGIVRGHGGAMRLYSEPGRGTTIRVLFPAAEQQEEPTMMKSDAESWLPATDQSVLVADDEDSVREMAVMVLRDAGISNVIQACDGAEAVEMFRRDPDAVALAVLDLTMPRMSGEEVFQQLRNIKPTLPVIVTSGYAEDDVALRFAGKGVQAFLQKPFHPDGLLRAVRMALQPETDSA